MVNFKNFISRHGEVAAQAMIENMERYEGVQVNVTSSLEDRWAALMEAYQAEQRLAA